MRRAVTCAAAAVVLLSGCAQTAPPLPAALPSASSATSASAPASDTSSAGSSASAASRTPSRGLTPSVVPKVLSTVKLPDAFGTYQASTPTGTGEQQVNYANPNDPKDTLNVAVTALADATTIASAYTKPALNGPAVCGTVSSNSSTVGSCALPLDKGAIVVTGSGTQTLDMIATATSALWAALP